MSSSGKTIRVLLVDDHAIVRAGLRRLLSDDPDIVVAGEAGDGPQALQTLGHLAVDLVLLDLAMPGMGGLQVLREVRRRHPGVRVLVLSMYPEEQYALQVFQAGGDGFISKGSVTGELIGAIRQVAGGGKYVTAAVAQRLAEQAGATGRPRAAVSLSDRELQTMRLIAAGDTTGEIAAKLGLSVKTVSTFRHRILKKLGLHSNVEIARYAQDQGLL